MAFDNDEKLQELPSYVKTMDMMHGIETEINYMGVNNVAVIYGLTQGYLRMHRTLQQNFMRLLVGFLKNLAVYYESYPERMDDRNKDSARFVVELAKFMKEKEEKNEGFYFPFI